MNKNELTSVVADKTGLSKTQAGEAVDAVFDAITAALKEPMTKSVSSALALLPFPSARPARVVTLPPAPRSIFRLPISRSSSPARA